MRRAGLWVAGLWLLSVDLADAEKEGNSCFEGCVCRKEEDCVTEARPRLLPSCCCDRGLRCCPVTGVSRQKCTEFVELSRDVCRPLALPLIVGGDLAAPGQVPHMATLGFGDAPKDAKWHCGGALVSERWVLTAAHCLHSASGPARWVRVGFWQDGRRGDSAAQEVAVESRVVHPMYRRPARYHDIALLRVEKVALSAGVRPACLHLPFALEVAKGQACGYGLVRFDDDKGSGVLRCAWLRLVSRVECAARLGDEVGGASLPQGLPRSILCAGDDEGARDTCSGDSGGPLHFPVEHPFCSYALVGVTAFGKFCGFAKTPGIYTRVSHYLPWIESLVWPKEVQDAQDARDNALVAYGEDVLSNWY